MIRRLSRQDGYVTAELAACMPVLLVLLLTGMVALSAASTQIHCVDAAREAALATARGEDGTAAATGTLPEADDIAIETREDIVTAQVTAEVHLPGSLLPPISVDGQATAATEPGVTS